MTKMVQEFIDKQEQRVDKENIFPISTDAQFVVNCLCEALLGEDWYVVDPIGVGQVNTLILDEILYKYYKPYKKLANKNAEAQLKDRKARLPRK